MAPPESIPYPPSTTWRALAPETVASLRDRNPLVQEARRQRSVVRVLVRVPRGAGAAPLGPERSAEEQAAGVGWAGDPAEARKALAARCVAVAARS